jgi:hypothetical protein
MLQSAVIRCFEMFGKSACMAKFGGCVEGASCASFTPKTFLRYRWVWLCVCWAPCNSPGCCTECSVTHVGRMSLDHDVWVESRLLHALITVGACLNVSRRGSWRRLRGGGCASASEGKEARGGARVGTRVGACVSCMAFCDILSLE